MTEDFSTVFGKAEIPDLDILCEFHEGVNCTVLYYIALYSTALYFTVLYYTTLYFTALYFTVL